MSKEIELSSTHVRVLSVVAQSIENSLEDITTRILKNNEKILLQQIKPIYSAEEKKEIIMAVEEIRKSLFRFVKKFSIKKNTVSEEQILRSQISYMWILLRDSYSNKLKNYGAVPHELQKDIDSSIDELLEKVEILRKIQDTDEEKS
jgi:hypothetical protein